MRYNKLALFEVCWGGVLWSSLETYLTRRVAYYIITKQGEMLNVELKSLTRKRYRIYQLYRLFVPDKTY